MFRSATKDIKVMISEIQPEWKKIYRAGQHPRFTES